MSVKKHLLAVVFAGIIVFIFQSASSAESKNVLTLNSYHQGFAWSDAEQEGLVNRLREVYPDINIAIEYLDAKIYEDEISMENIKEALKIKYTGRKIDMIVALDDPALHLLVHYSKELFSYAPVVFAGVTDFSQYIGKGRKNITGVIEKQDLDATLDAALKIFPDTKEVLLIIDSTISGRVARKKAEEIIQSFSDRVNFRFNKPGSFEDVRDEIRSLNKGAIALIVSFSTDSKGHVFSHRESTKALTDGVSISVFGLHETRLGYGIIGGYLLGGREHGRRAAEIALRILGGEDPMNIPIDESGTSVPKFDYLILKRFGVNEDDLPSGSVIVNKPVSVFETHRELAVGALVLVVLLSALVIMLSVSIIRRKRIENELLLTQLCVDKSPIAFARITDEGKVEAVNETMCRNLGYTEKELCSMSVFDFDPTFDTETFKEHRKKVGSEGTRTIETFHKRKDGSIFPVEVTVNRVAYKGRSVSYSFTKDITERKRAEDELKESQSRLTQLIDFLPDPTFAIDVQGRVIAWNRAIAEMTGVQPEAVLGKDNFEYSFAVFGVRRPMLIDLVNSADEEVSQFYPSAVRKGKILMAESTATIKGEERSFWANAAAFFDNNGVITGYVETIRDITERKLFEQEQARLKEQIFQLQKMETLGLLAEGVANDFGNLLTPILGYSSIMLAGLSGDDPKRIMVEEIKHCAERAKDLTKRLLAFSRKQVIDLKVVNLGEEIKGLMPLLDSVVRDNIKISIEIDPEIGYVRADMDQIGQALLNLVANAQDAMPEGGKLTISAQNFNVEETNASVEAAKGFYVALSVRDTGVGMDKDIQKRIFEPFFTTKKLGRGSGLGLATVYGIVKQHGGTILVHSEKNKGSVFEIILPRVLKNGRRMETQSVEKNNTAP